MSMHSNIATLAPRPDVADLPALFKALGDPLRVNTLRLLGAGSLSVSELCEVTGLRQSALSHHLKILVQANLLVRRREGTAIYYRRQLPAGEYSELLYQILASIDGEPLSADALDGLERVQAQREQNSRDFFRDNSARFRHQKELIASWKDYSQATLQMLDRCTGLARGRLLEVGPGDGALLPALATRAAEVIALDNAPAMLETARAAAGGLTNIRFIEGEIDDLDTADHGLTAAVINMVLHHTRHPDTMIADVARLLAPSGWLVISELCAHDQNWAREHCGDLWLGFEPSDLTRWAELAGLEGHSELFIAQRNGFQIQVRLFRKRQK